MTLGWASNDPKLHQTRLATIAKRAKAARLKTKYWTPELHVGAFALPRFVQDHIK
jgi:spermidine synthase